MRRKTNPEDRLWFYFTYAQYCSLYSSRMLLRVSFLPFILSFCWVLSLTAVIAQWSLSLFYLYNFTCGFSLITINYFMLLRLFRGFLPSNRMEGLAPRTPTPTPHPNAPTPPSLNGEVGVHNHEVLIWGSLWSGLLGGNSWTSQESILFGNSFGGILKVGCVLWCVYLFKSTFSETLHSCFCDYVGKRTCDQGLPLFECHFLRTCSLHIACANEPITENHTSFQTFFSFSFSETFLSLFPCKWTLHQEPHLFSDLLADLGDGVFLVIWGWILRWNLSSDFILKGGGDGGAFDVIWLLGWFFWNETFWVI